MAKNTSAEVKENTPATPQFVSRRRAAGIIECHPRHLIRYEGKSLTPYRTPGGSIRYLLPEVLALLTPKI